MLDFLFNLDIMGFQDELSAYSNIIAFSLGVVLHILKKVWMEECTIKEYLMTHKIRSMLSLGSLVSTYLLITTMYPGSQLIVYFLCGYSIDSLVNKAPLTSRKLQKENIL